MPEEVEDDDTYPASDLEDGNTGGQTDVPDDADGDIENLVADPEPAQSHIAKIFQGEAKAALNRIKRNSSKFYAIFKRLFLTVK